MIVDPGTGIARHIPDPAVLRANCEKIVATSSNSWQLWAARQLYALGCAPKLLAAPKTVRFGTGWVNPNCIVELRFDEQQPVRPHESTHVFTDGVRYADVLDAAQAAWIANEPNLAFEIAERYGLYWRVTWGDRLQRQQMRSR